MARDNHVPFSRALARVNEGTRLPGLPALVIGVSAAALLAANADAPNLIEGLAATAIVWANLAYLFVTVPMLRRRLTRRDPSATPPPGFSLGRWGLPVNAAAVAWGVFVVVNTGWPRAEVFGDGWLGRTGALVPTAAMLLAGALYDRLVRRHRKVGVLDEHRADPTAPEPAPVEPTPAADPAPPRRRLRDRLRIRPRRLTRPRR